MTDTPRCEPPPELRGVDGWHWVKCGDDGREFVARWSAAPHSGLEPLWARYGESATPVWAAAHWDWRYLSPVATPAEVAALRAERDALKLRERSVTDQLRRVAEERETALAEVDRLRDAIHSAWDMIENCAGVPTNPDSLPQMVKHHLIAALEPKP